MMNTVWSFLSFPLTYPARQPLFWLLLSPGIAFMGAVAGSQAVPDVFYAVLITLTYPAAFIMFALNDLYDQATDDVNDRSFVKDNIIGDDDTALVWGWAGIFTVCCLAPVIWFGKASTILLGCFLVVAAVTYSVPPFRFKTNPVLSLILMMFGGWSLYAFGYSFTDSVWTIPTRSFYYALLSHTAVSFGALPDIEADRAAEDTTFPVVYGERATILLGLASIVVTVLSGTVSGPVLYFLLVYGAGMVSMLFFKRYVLHFKAITVVGIVILAWLWWRGVMTLG